jgi:UDP-N-acetylglucosamine:LPS N-acetylglucosamine transferase
VYGASMRVWAWQPAIMQRIALWSAGELRHAIEAEITATRPDVVVSMYNLAALAVGDLVAAGRVGATTITVVTDAGAHPYWVHPAVGLHIAPLRTTARRLHAMGASAVVTAPPLVAPRELPDAMTARQRLDLPEGRIALLSAGSWAAGRLAATVEQVVDQDLSVVVLCGRDETLCRGLRRHRRVWPVGWTDQVPSYIAAADVVVDNAGGLTCWEAIRSGTPVVIVNPLPGHGRLNAAALVRAGLVRCARRRSELVTALRPRVCGPRYARVFAATPVEEHALARLPAQLRAA